MVEKIVTSLLKAGATPDALGVPGPRLRSKEEACLHSVSRLCPCWDSPSTCLTCWRPSELRRLRDEDVG